jgi:hypothetical protein
MKKKRLLVDLIGYASLIPVLWVYITLESRSGGYVAVACSAALLIPISYVWHKFYRKYEDPA